MDIQLDCRGTGKSEISEIAAADEFDDDQLFLPIRLSRFHEGKQLPACRGAIGVAQGQGRSFSLFGGPCRFGESASFSESGSQYVQIDGPATG